MANSKRIIKEYSEFIHQRTHKYAREKDGILLDSWQSIRLLDINGQVLCRVFVDIEEKEIDWASYDSDGTRKVTITTL